MSSLSPFHNIHLHSSANNFPVLSISLVAILATALLLLCYYIFVVKCCLTLHHPINTSTNPTSSLDHTNNTPDFPRGLEESLIRSIPLIKFRKSESEREKSNHPHLHGTIHDPPSYECAVCLNEFEDGERLRVIPICCHAFHIDCIDVWLQNNANCPVCRSGISPSSIFSYRDNGTAVPEPDQDFLVIEIDGNNFDEPKLVPNNNKKVVNSKGDEWIDARKKKCGEFGDLQDLRRSVSLDLTADREFRVEIQQWCCDVDRQQVSSGSTSSSSSGGKVIKVRQSIFSIG